MGENEQKLLSLLGLARRAGRLALGYEPGVEQLRAGAAALLLGAADVSEKTWKNLCFEGNRAGVPARRLTVGMEELSRAVGAKKTGVLTVTDPGFAGKLLALTEQAHYSEQKEEHSL